MFKLKAHETSATVEIMAGVTTFFSMVYVLAVNPAILQSAGMPKEALFTGTCLAAIAGCLLMAFIANLPFAVAPGMGINAFFVAVVTSSLNYSWPQVLTAVLISGVLFFILSASPVREKIIAEVPDSIKYGVCGGVGIMIASIGLCHSHVLNFSSGLPNLGDLHDSSAQLAIIGIFIMAILLARKIRFSPLICIITVTLLGIPLGVTDVSRLSGDFISLPPSLTPIFMKFDFSLLTSLDFYILILTFIFIEIVISLAGFLGLFSIMAPQDELSYRKKLGKAFMADSLAVVSSSILGVSPNTVYAESGTGIAGGGRTGLCSLSTAACFVIALLAAPLFLIVPFAAVTPALIMVGWLMLGSLTKLDFSKASESFPAIVAVVVMGLSWQISDGLALSWLTYLLMKIIEGRYRSISATSWILGLIFALKIIL